MLKKLTKKRNQKGFTLVELVVVIAILGILMAIAVPRLMGFRTNAQLSADKATAATIGKAAELYAASNNLEQVEISDLTEAKLIENEDTTSNLGGEFLVNYDEDTGKAKVEYTDSVEVGKEKYKELYPKSDPVSTVPITK